MNEMRHINSYLLQYLKQKYEVPWSGDFSTAIEYKKLYINTSTGKINSSSGYNLYFIKLPKYAQYITVTHNKLSSNLYGMGFTKKAGSTNETVSVITYYNRLSSPTKMKIPQNANYFVLTATTNEISKCSYSME